MIDYTKWKLKHELSKNKIKMRAIICREKIGDLYIRMNIEPDVANKFILNRQIIIATDRLLLDYIEYQELTLINWCNEKQQPIKKKTYEHIKYASKDINDIQMYKKDRLLYHNINCVVNTLRDFIDINGNCMCIRNRHKILHVNDIHNKKLKEWGNISTENFPAFLLDWDK